MEADFTTLNQIVTELKKELGVDARETLKLEKNSKGYNWEIKIFIDKSPGDTEAIERLEWLNSKLNEKFSNEETKRGN